MDNDERDDEREDDKLDIMKHDDDERSNNMCPRCGSQMTPVYDSYESGVIGRYCAHCGYKEEDVS